MNTNNTPQYMATVLPGLEDISGGEITEKITDAKLTNKERGKIFFTSDLPLKELLNIRTIDNLYLFITGFTLGPHKTHLKDLEHFINGLDLPAFLDKRIWQQKEVTFVVNSSRSGKHTYSRFDLSAAAVRGILKQALPWRMGTPDHHKLEFRLDLSGEQGLFSLRLTSQTFRFRGSHRKFSKASLRPTVAHSLIWISKPQKDECFMDPFCGSGTILAERVFYPSQTVIGGDISEKTVSLAKQNIPSGQRCEIRRWDATSLPVDKSSVNTVVTNLPFGKQILNPDEIALLYLKFLMELRRVLVSDGRAYLLTDKIENLNRAVDKTGFRNKLLFQLSLKGLHPWVVQLSKD